MYEFLAGTYDIAVIGAGHAGIEAALAAARMGCRTVCFTINLDAVPKKYARSKNLPPRSIKLPSP